MDINTYVMSSCSSCNTTDLGGPLGSNGKCLRCIENSEFEVRIHCEVLPYFNVIGHNDLLEILNYIGKTRPESVSTVISTKANFNLDACGQPGRLNNDDIDPDINMYNEALLDAQYVSPSALARKFVQHGNLTGLMHINGRSILSKMQEFQLLVAKIPVSFVAISETWVNKNTEDQLQLTGYTAVYNSREDRIGGGVRGYFGQGEHQILAPRPWNKSKT